jgi:hypothetical protein
MGKDEEERMRTLLDIRDKAAKRSSERRLAAPLKMPAEATAADPPSNPTAPAPTKEAKSPAKRATRKQKS